LSVVKASGTALDAIWVPELQFVPENVLPPFRLV